MRSLSQLLHDFVLELEQGQIENINKNITFKAFVEALHERGFGIILFIFAAPMGLPIPVPPGLNVILAIPLLFLTFQQMTGAHRPWFPDWVLRREISRQKIIHALNAVIPWIEKFEYLIRPRLEFMTRGLSSRLIGLAGFYMALAVCVPVPLTNTVPSFGIAMMAIGVLMRDGLAVLVGLAVGTAWVSGLIFMVLLGIHTFA